MDDVLVGPISVDWGDVDPEHMIVLPPVTLDDMEQFDFDYSALREDNPDMSEEEFLEFAAGEFRMSDSYPDWRDQFRPMMNVLWPCEPMIDRDEAAKRFREENIACVYIHGDHDGIPLRGIALTGGGMNLSDHLAAAYMLCGRRPPLDLLQSALAMSRPKLEDRLVEMAEEVVSGLENTAENMREQIARRKPAGPNP